jgi:hypothetical protein
MMSATARAREITAVLRALLPQVQPLQTKVLLSGEGMVLGFEVTLPGPAARSIGATNLDSAHWLAGHLNRHLAGGPVHVTSIWVTRRRDYSKLTHLRLETGEGPSASYCPKGHEYGQHDMSCMPDAAPALPELRLVRAIWGLCPDCNRTEPHYHREPVSV